MCYLYATWMRLGGNRNIQCKLGYGIPRLDSCPNFFLPSQPEKGTHSHRLARTSPSLFIFAFMASERSRTLYKRGIG